MLLLFAPVSLLQGAGIFVADILWPQAVAVTVVIPRRVFPFVRVRQAHFGVLLADLIKAGVMVVVVVVRVVFVIVAMLEDEVESLILRTPI